MLSLNVLIIIIAVLFIFGLWLVVGFRHLKYLYSGVDEAWEDLGEHIRKRHNLIPILIETVRMYEKEDNKEIFEKLISARLKAAKKEAPGMEKIELEYDLTQALAPIQETGQKNADLSKDTTYLELKKEFSDIKNLIEAKTKSYNSMVRHYEKYRHLVFLRPISMLFGFGPKNIFEMEF
jgi:hypothetical protein